MLSVAAVHLHCFAHSFLLGRHLYVTVLLVAQPVLQVDVASTHLDDNLAVCRLEELDGLPANCVDARTHTLELLVAQKRTIHHIVELVSEAVVNRIAWRCAVDQGNICVSLLGDWLLFRTLELYTCAANKVFLKALIYHIFRCGCGVDGLVYGLSEVSLRRLLGQIHCASVVANRLVTLDHLRSSLKVLGFSILYVGFKLLVLSFELSNFLVLKFAFVANNLKSFDGIKHLPRVFIIVLQFLHHVQEELL